jgi:poly(A) polymerase
MLNKQTQTSTSGQAAILSAKDHPISSTDIGRGALQVVEVLQEAGFEAYLVGGCVRDLLLDLHPKDFDVATSATPEQVKRLFRSARIIGRRFRIVHVRVGRDVTEVTTFRAQHQDASINEEDGRVLSDNVYGDLYSDAMRRDFTMNALYYDPANEQIRDYCQGVADIRARRVRMIGDPSLRYQEDPVRLLRAVRLAAKLNFDIEVDTAIPILKLGKLLLNVPAARLFDESLKLLMSGYAEVTWQRLREQKLVEYLFPATFHALEQGNPIYSAALLIEQACRNTDHRIRTEQRVTPAFIFAVILWPAVVEAQQSLQAEGQTPLASLHQAMQSVLSEQSQHIAIPRRFTNTMREIWELQLRLPRRHGTQAQRLMQHPRFRAAYDFLLLRESAGEALQQLGQWWTDFQQADEGERLTMTNALASPKGGSRRRKRRKPKAPSNAE